MITETIKNRILEATKGKNDKEKSLLKVVLSEIQAASFRKKNITEEENISIIRKMLNDNNDIMSKVSDEKYHKILKEENTILGSLLPVTLSKDVILSILTEQCLGDIISSKSDGQATGVAMKCLKNSGANVLGKDVSEVVSQIRKTHT